MKVLIAAGGTGGHIYPGLAIAEALKSVGGIAVDIEFVGTAHGLENKIIPEKGYTVHHLKIGRLNSNVSVRERILTILLLPLAFIQSALLLLQTKPKLVLGVGGHASGPLLLVASWLGFYTAIWEPNAMPGLANRWLARFVDECWVVFDEARRFLKSSNLLAAGMPVRKEIESCGLSRSNEFGFHVLVFGGSLGAKALNSCVTEMIKEGGEWMKDIQFVHQTGVADYRRVRELYGAAVPYNVEIKEYLNDMAKRYAWADLVICRSGAATLSELAACGKPSILVPFPFASDDHQRKNAESLVSRGAAQMILQKELNVGKLREAILAFKQNKSLLTAMSGAVQKFHKPNAAEDLASQFYERIKSHALS